MHKGEDIMEGLVAVVSVKLADAQFESQTKAKLGNTSIGQLVRDIINDTQPEPIKIEKIIAEVAKTYNVSESDILSNRRTSALALARQVAMYIARETTNLSYKAIGESFGKDHTTVLYNVNRIENFLKDKPYEKELVDDIIKNLTSGASDF